MRKRILNRNDRVSQYTSLIGEIIISIRVLEHEIDQFLWGVIDANDTPTSDPLRIEIRITNTLMFRQKIDLLNSIISGRFKKEITKLFQAEVYQPIKDLGELRNDIVHSFWAVNAGNITGGKINYKKLININNNEVDFSKGMKRINISDLENILQTIYKSHLLLKKHERILLKQLGK